MFGPEHDVELLKTYTWEKIDQDVQLERDLRALLYFHDFLLFRGVNNGRELQGCSFSQRGQHVMLVVKSRTDDTQDVAFITEKNTTGCIVTFGRQWLEGRVKWYPDRYA